jgi:Homeodomain-like domain
VHVPSLVAPEKSKRVAEVGNDSRAVARQGDVERKRARFLELLCDGESVVRAAAGAKVGRRTVYDWRNADAEFAREWDEAWEQGTDLLEEVALKRAVNGSDLLLIFLLKGRRPQRYRDNVRHEVDARLTVSVEDARAQLEQRLAVIEDHRRRALPATSVADVGVAGERDRSVPPTRVRLDQQPTPRQ